MTRRCRSCGAEAVEPFLDLGPQPLAGWFPGPGDVPPDPTWPLRPAVCRRCWLVQLSGSSPDEFEAPDAPLPTGSRTMAAHARAFVADLAGRGLATPTTTTLELASHGGHLQPFFAQIGVPTVVLEASPTRAARLAQEGGRVVSVTLGDAPADPLVTDFGPAHLLVDHYLLAHLEDPEGALAAMARLLAPDGWLALEFDHLLPTIEGRQFDAFRHGHRSYLSLTWLAEALARQGLVAVEAKPFPVYGGALRVLARRAGAGDADVTRSVAAMLEREAAAGLGDVSTFHAFARDVAEARSATVAFLNERAGAGRPVAAYGAPARAVTLLNYYGLGPELLAFTADASPTKQGRAIPGVRLPITAPEALRVARPAEVLILTWDIAPEVIAQLEGEGSWGARYLVPLPRLTEVGVR